MELTCTEPLGGHWAPCPGFFHLFQLGPECTLRQTEPLQLCVTENNSHCLQQKKKKKILWGGHRGVARTSVTGTHSFQARLSSLFLLCDPW